MQATTLFELPPDEIQLMQQVTSEIQKARRWAFFDAIFGSLAKRLGEFLEPLSKDLIVNEETGIC